MKKLWFPPFPPPEPPVSVSQHLPHTPLSSTLPPATLHTAGLQLNPRDTQPTRHHGTACPLLGHTCILPHPMPQIFLASGVISGMSSLLETDQSSGITGWKHKPRPTSAVAPLQITLPSLIPKWQSQGAKAGSENYGKVFVVLLGFF